MGALGDPASVPRGGVSLNACDKGLPCNTKHPAQVRDLHGHSVVQMTPEAITQPEQRACGDLQGPSPAGGTSREGARADSAGAQPGQDLLAQLAAGAATAEHVAAACAAGWDPNAAAQGSGDTALHVAARLGDAGVCAALLAAGASPLAWCAWQARGPGHRKGAARFVLEPQSGSPAHRNTRGRTPGGQRTVGSSEAAEVLRRAEAAARAARSDRWGQKLQALQTDNACTVQTL